MCPSASWPLLVISKCGCVQGIVLALSFVGAGDTTPNSMAPYAGNNTGTVSRGNGVPLLKKGAGFAHLL